MTIQAANTAMQALYERGSLSYPRAGAVGFSESTSAQMTALATDLGLAPVQRLPLWTPTPSAAHESPHPASPRALRDALKAPAWMLSDSDRAMARWARQALRQMIGAQDEIADVPDTLPMWLTELRFTRPDPATEPFLAEPFDEDHDHRAAMTLYDADEIAFRGLTALGLGEPSTLADHAERMVEHGYVDAGGVTQAGRDLAAQTDPALCGMRFAHRADRALGRCSQDAAAVIGDESMLDVLAEAVGEAWPAVAATVDTNTARNGSTPRQPTPDQAVDRDDGVFTPRHLAVQMPADGPGWSM